MESSTAAQANVYRSRNGTLTVPIIARVRLTDRDKLFRLAEKNQTSVTQIMRVALEKFLAAAKVK